MEIEFLGRAMASRRLEQNAAASIDDELVCALVVHDRVD